MRSLFDSPVRVLLAGAAIVALQIVFWVALSRPDALGFAVAATRSGKHE